MSYVKTVYDPDHFRKPNITLYHNEVDAKLFVKTAQKYGMGISSCGIIPKEMAREQIAAGTVDFEEEN